MSPERWHRVREVLYAASQLEGGARVAYLEENCARDHPLREEVERLLSALQESGGFLDLGPRIGPYVVLERAGFGGMGVVYHAVRENDYRQEVAIKVVRDGAETDYRIERFRLERQTLALLNHPNIARLLDGGTTPDGWPYLVMEWVDGQPISDYCKTRQLGLRERLKLFLEVADAVEHAHRNLVVHRDLKPSNILVSAQGTPKLLDFGIAKIYSEANSTRTATRLLTPEYASPEQLRGEAVTTATDIYSLGAVLYEILADVRPHDALPPSAASGRRELRGDLDNIVRKAMQPDPKRRYGSAGHFAEDVRRYLEGLPVTARKDTLAYRVGKFARRNRMGVVAGALILAALAAGAVTTLWQARIAEHRFNDVRRLAHSYLFEIDDAIKNLPGSTAARSLVVRRALEYLDGLVSESRGDRALEAEIAAAYERVGEVQGDPLFPNLGDTQGALASSRKSLAIREALARSDPRNRELQMGLAAIHGQIADILDVSGDSRGAIEHSGKALAMYQQLGAGRALITQTYNHANRLRLARDLDGAAAAYRRAVELTADPADAEGKVHLATSLDGLGGVLQEKGETAGALENRRRGLAIREQLAASAPDNAHYRRQLGFSHHNVGLSLMAAGDLDGALGHFRQELAIFEALSAADPKDVQGMRNRSLALKQIGDTLMRKREFSGAAEQYSKSLAIDRGLAAGDPGNVKALLDLSFSEGKAGLASVKLGRTRTGLVLLRSGVERQEQMVSRDPANRLLSGFLANSYTRLAEGLRDAGSPQAAQEYDRKAFDARLRSSPR